MKWHTSGEFAPLMLVVSGPEKYKLVATLGQAAEILMNCIPARPDRYKIFFPIVDRPAIH
ncbi:DUF982 domain-containing protein, partial [Rhizobium ruizarguesonis]